MSRGQELAVDEINAAGGVAGYQLELVKVDTQAQQPDVMKTVLQNLVSQNVAAVFMPFCSYTSVEFPIVADKKIPTFHVNTWHGNVDWVAQNNATNIFQGDPSELSYGSGIVAVMNALIADGSWTPSKKTAYVVTSNDPYSLNIAKSFQSSVQKQGWQVVGFDQFTAPQANWGGVLVKIRDANPGMIVFSDYAAGDEAAFMKQFAQQPDQVAGLPAVRAVDPAVPPAGRRVRQRRDLVDGGRHPAERPGRAAVHRQVHRQVRIRARLLERRRPVRPDEDLGAGGGRGRRIRTTSRRSTPTSRRRPTAVSAGHTRSTAPG